MSSRKTPKKPINQRPKLNQRSTATFDCMDEESKKMQSYKYMTLLGVEINIPDMRTLN